jgi:hypothetical protein
MKLKQIIYIMFILTGILVEKYGLKTNNPELEKYFGFGAISLGSFNLVLDYIKKPKKK